MSSVSSRWRWITEWFTPSNAHLWCVEEVIFQGETKYQQVDIFRTSKGMVLMLDGKTQSTSMDEWIYHEALVHPVMLTHPQPKKVLIIGGGEGATLREVLRYKSVEKVVMVDIDEELIELCKKYLVDWHRGAFFDRRVELVIGDGRAYISKCCDEFDVVIIDVTDPYEGGPAALLYTKQFYEKVYRALKPDGLMVTQATSTFFSLNVFADIYATIKSVFEIARPYHVFVPFFLSTWGFVIGSKKYDPVKIPESTLVERINEQLSTKDELRFYDEQIHYALFTLPKYIRKILTQGRVATDENPPSMPI